MLVCILNEKSDRRSLCLTFKDARQNPDPVRLAPACRKAALTRLSPVQILLDILFPELQSGRGQPSITQPIPAPWLSPQVVTLYSVPNVEPAIQLSPCSPGVFPADCGVSEIMMQFGVSTYCCFPLMTSVPFS